MKSKIMLIILSIVSVVSISLLIYQSKTYVKIPTKYECETVEQEENSVKSKQAIIVNINKEQYVESYQNKDITIYSDIEQYNSIKEIPSTEEVTYKFNDKTMTVTAEYKLNQMIDSEGSSTEVWYKEYIKNVELSGYTCKIIK